MIDDPRAPPPDPVAPPPAADASAEPLDFPLPCRHCGYNLQGLSPHGDCPECGVPVERSLRSDFLRFADPSWIEGVANGALLIAVGTILGVAMSCLSGGIGGTPAGAVLGAILTALPTLVYAFGVWRVTEPESGRWSEAPPPGYKKAGHGRSTARWWVCAGVGLGVLGAAITPVDPDAAGSFNVPGALASFVGFVALLIYLRHLALRLPDESLAGQTRVVMWGTIASLGVFLAMLIAIVAIFGVAALSGGDLDPAAAGASGIAAFCGFCVGLLGLAVFGVWWLVLTFRYHGRLKAAAAQAQQTWTAPPPDPADAWRSTHRPPEPWERR